jgi:hypothetical protein
VHSSVTEMVVGGVTTLNVASLAQISSEMDSTWEP